MSDFFVEAADGVRLAARDHGGDGPPLVLLHGAGAHLASVGYLARQLRDFHVVSMDARWSGLSGDAPTYTWTDLVRDVEVVAGAAGLDEPAVVGHSWGGMIAAHYGAAHPEAPGVVNLDGHGLARDPALFDGMSAAEVEAALRTLDTVQAIESGGAGAVGDAAWFRDQAESMGAGLRAGGLRPELVDSWVARSFVELGDGRFKARPAVTLYDGLTGDLGLFELYRRVRCPLLVLDSPKSVPTGHAELDPVMAAYRRGLTRTLAALDEEVPGLSVVHLPDADHQSIVGRDAPRVAELVRAFLRDGPAGGPRGRR